MIKLLDRINALCFYRNLLDKPILKEFYELIKQFSQPEYSKQETEQKFYELRSLCVDYALKINNPQAKSVWGNIIISYLTSSSPVTTYIEKNNKSLFKNTLVDDLEIIADLYNFDFNPVIEILSPGTENIFQKNIFSRESGLARRLKSKRGGRIYTELVKTIRTEGLGIFKDAHVFKINPAHEKDSEFLISPIEVKNSPEMTDLVGYESQKEKLIQNTRSFVNQTGGLNTLLYGEMGTGKSTMVRSLINEFKGTPLRFIEIKKEEIELLPDVVNLVSGLSYPFIIFIDDLSFEQNDGTYRALKNSLEGSFESFPENLLLYATSNKRTLITQSKSERNDAVNAREILAEKLSLVSRFGLMIPFSVPDQSSYLNIVKELADRNDIVYDDTLEEEAIQWELRHMNKSGRTAEQFIKYLQTEQ